MLEGGGVLDGGGGVLDGGGGGGGGVLDGGGGAMALATEELDRDFWIAVLGEWIGIGGTGGLWDYIQRSVFLFSREFGAVGRMVWRAAKVWAHHFGSSSSKVLDTTSL